MSFKSISLLNAVLFIILGIAFALYGPLMINFFGVLEVPGATGETYWFVASFARLYGAILFGFGYVLWAIHRAGEHITPTTRQKLTTGMLLAHLVGLFVAVTQQFTIWLKPIGWGLAAFYLLFCASYAYLLARGQQ